MRGNNKYDPQMYTESSVNIILIWESSYHGHELLGKAGRWNKIESLINGSSDIYHHCI